MRLRPQTSVEKEILEIWCRAGPSDAFIAGFPDYAGRVLIPSREIVDSIRRRIATCQAQGECDSQRKLLACLDTYLTILEPSTVLSYILDSFFGHLIKEGVKVAHMASLAEYSRKALEAYLEAHAATDWPIGQRILGRIRCDGLLEILNVIHSNMKSSGLKASLNLLVATVNSYKKYLHVEGFKTGAFDEIWKIVTEQGCALNRQQIYAQALRDLYDYHETPSEVEEKGLRFLESELGGYRKLVQEFAENLGCEPSAEAVRKLLRDEKSLPVKKIIPHINKVRRLVVKIVNKRIVGVNPKYYTRVVETPSYLSGVLPTGAAYFLNYLTSRPRQMFLATTDPLRDPESVPAELLNLLVHEEYGHCVHASNSAHGYGAKPEFVEMLGSFLGGAISEGISFQRELEFLDHLNRIGNEKKLTKEEKAFMKLCEGLGGFETVRREYEFFTRT